MVWSWWMSRFPMIFRVAVFCDVTETLLMSCTVKPSMGLYLLKNTSWFMAGVHKAIIYAGPGQACGRPGAHLKNRPPFPIIPIAYIIPHTSSIGRIRIPKIDRRNGPDTFENYFKKYRSPLQLDTMKRRYIRGAISYVSSTSFSMKSIVAGWMSTLGRSVFSRRS